MNDIEKKIEELKSEFLTKLEGLKKEAEMQKKQEEPKPWKPEDGEDYFYIGIDFTIDSWENVDDDTDKRNFRIGNCFPFAKLLLQHFGLAIVRPTTVLHKQTQGVWYRRLHDSTRCSVI